MNAASKKHLLLTTTAAVVLVGAAFADPIHDAAKSGDLADVQAELDKGVDVNAKNINGWTSLHLAAINGHNEVAELLIFKGADVNEKDEWGWTPLHYTANIGYKKIAELLIFKGANVNAQSEDKKTALHTAAYWGQKEVAELLIGKGADVNTKHDGGMTPLDFAVIYNQTEIAHLLRKYGGGHGTIHGAASGGDIEAVGEFLNAGVDVDAKDDRGNTPLYAALLSMHKEVSELLVAKGADVNIKQQNGETILHQVIDASLPTGFYPLEIAEWLISNGADVNAEYDHGVTPLFLAVQAWREEAVQLLIDNGADLNIISRFALWGFEDATPLDWAIEEDFDQIADLLRKHGGKTVEELKALMPRLVQHSRFAFNFGTKEGMTYEVQDSLNLTNWEVIKTYKGTGGAVRFDEERDHDPPQIFYRIKVVE